MMEDVLNFIKEERRVCPKPDKWNELWKMLPDKQQKGAGWNPPLPLILAAWWETTDGQKRERLELHIKYAAEKDVLDKVEVFLKDLLHEEWVYEGDV